MQASRIRLPFSLDSPNSAFTLAHLDLLLLKDNNVSSERGVHNKGSNPGETFTPTTPTIVATKTKKRINTN